MTGRELKAGAREAIFDNAPRLFVVSIIFVLIVTVLSELQFRLAGTDGLYSKYIERIADGEPHSVGLLVSFLSPVGLALSALLFLLGGIVQVGFMSYCLKISRSHGGDYKDILNGFLFARKVLAIMIVSSALVALWTLLLIFPGIAAHYRYRQAYYILLDDPGKGALQCIRESKLLMYGNKLDLFLVDLSFLGWHILSYATTLLMLLVVPVSLPIVSVWLSPYIGVARASYYDHLLAKAAM